MDACLMGGLEVAQELMGTTRFFVGSPDLVAGDGLEYQHILAASTLTSQTNARVWSQQVVASFGQCYDSANGYDTIMAADVNQVAEVSRQVSGLADVLVAQMATERPKIAAARRESHRYSEDVLAGGMYRYSVDLNDFCDELAKRSSSGAVKRQAQAVLQAMSNLIVGSWKDAQYPHTTDGQKGLSIFFPRNNFDPSFPEYTARSLTFLQDARQHWDEFLRAYLGPPVRMASSAATGSEFSRWDGIRMRDGTGTWRALPTESQTPCHGGPARVALTDAGGEQPVSPDLRHAAIPPATARAFREIGHGTVPK
jgi:hypothetical protein